MNALKTTEKERAEEEKVKGLVTERLGFDQNGYKDSDDEEELEKLNDLEHQKIKSERAAKFEEEFSRFKLLFEQGQLSLKGQGEVKTKEPSEEGELSRSEQEDGLSLSEDDSTEEILFSSSEDEENKEHSRHRKEKRRLLLRGSEQEELLRLQHLKKAQLTRDQLEEWVDELYFEEVIKGAYVRVCAKASVDRSQQVYKVGEILGYERVEKPYKIKTKPTNKMLLLGLGKSQRLFKITFVSNSGFEVSQFEEWMRTFKEIGSEAPRSMLFEKKGDEIAQFKNYEYTVLETEIKIANNMLQKLRHQPTELLAKTLNLQQLTDAVRVKLAQFKRDQDRAERIVNLKPKQKKELGQRKELIVKNKEIMERLTQLKQKLVELEDQAEVEQKQSSQERSKNALEKFCSSKNISVEEIERAASFLPIRSFFKEQRDNEEEEAGSKEITDFQILEEIKTSKHLEELNGVLRERKKELEEATKLIRPRYLNEAKFKRRQKIWQKEEAGRRKAMKQVSLEELKRR